MSIINDILIEFLDSGDRVFYGYLLQKMLIIKDNSIPTLSVGGYNGRLTLRYNEGFLAGLSLKKQLAAIEHEILHVANNHNERFSDRKTAKYKTPFLIGTDTAINQLIKDMPIGSISFEILQEVLLKNKLVKENELKRYREAEYYVEYLKKLVQKQQEEYKDENGKGCNHFDKTDEEKGLTQLEKFIFQEECVQAGIRSGNAPSGIDKLIEEWTKIAKISWKQILKIQCAMAVQSDLLYSWKRLRRRNPDGIDLKGTIKNYKPKIVVAIDTSGSIYGNPGILEEFTGQLKNIQDCYKAKFTVIECDAEIQKVYELDEQTKIQKTFKGGGGTDFRPVFDICEKKYKPGLLIYLTDGEGNFPNRKYNFRTVWCSIHDNETLFPFGKFIKVNVNND